MRYSASKNSVTLKTGLRVVQGHWKWRRSIDHIRLSFGHHCKYSSIWYSFFELFEVEWYHDLEIRVTSHSRSHKPVPFDSLGAVSYSPSIVTMAVYCIVCKIKWDIGRKSWFFIPPLHSTPPLGGSPSEYCHPVWCEKTRMVGLPDGEKNLRICITDKTQYRRVTDRRTSCA